MRRTIGLAGLREVAVVDDDIDQSGRTFTRPGIARIRHLVETRQVDVVAVYNLSRVGRNLAESLLFLKWLRDHDVEVISAQEPMDDSPEGQYMTGQWLGMAQLRSDQIAREWQRVLERRARAGKKHGNTNQGYLRDESGRLVPDPVLAPAVTAMFVAYARGDTVADIAKAYAAARGKPITRSRVKVMLRHPVYRGHVVLKSKTGGYLDLPGMHPPLVDDQTWAAVARRIADDQTTPPRYLAPQYSLTGLLSCAECGQTLSVWCSTEKGKGELAVPRVICPRRREVVDTAEVAVPGRRKRDAEPSRPACAGIGSPVLARIEEVLLERIHEYAGELVGNPAARAQQLARAAKAGVDAATLKRELASTREAMARLTERWARGIVPDSAYEVSIAKFIAEEKVKSERLAEAQENSEVPDPGKTVRLVDEMLAMWPDMTGTERNLALRTVIRGATVRRAAYWREPEADRVVEVRFRS